MNLPAAEIAPTNRSTPMVELANVSFAWPEAGGARRFGISVDALSLPTGSRTLLLGPSGGGKSTLLSLLGGIVSPSSGTIKVLDADFTKMSNAKRDRFRAEHIGVLFQMFNLLPYGSVIDNVLLPLSFAPRRHNKAREDGGGSEVNAAKKILSEFGLVDALLDAPAATLSVGQQQRVAAARALIGSPELIIADEPTSALDRKNQDQFIDRLFAQLDASGSTLIMVTHDERLTSRFDSVLQLTDIVRVVEST